MKIISCNLSTLLKSVNNDNFFLNLLHNSLLVKEEYKIDFTHEITVPITVTHVHAMADFSWQHLI